MSSSGLVLPPGSPTRAGKLTGSETAPVPAFASPLPSLTDPCQSTSTCRSNVAIGSSMVRDDAEGRPLRTLLLASSHTELHGGADQAEADPRDRNPAPSGRGRH